MSLTARQRRESGPGGFGCLSAVSSTEHRLAPRQTRVAVEAGSGPGTGRVARRWAGVGPWHAVGWSGQDPKPDAPTTDADAAEAGQLTRATQAVSRGGGQAAEVHHSGGRRASNRRRSKVQNPRPASGGQLSRPSNRRPAPGGQRSEAGSRRSALEGQRLEASSRRPAAGASCPPRRAGTGQLPPPHQACSGGRRTSPRP